MSSLASLAHSRHAAAPAFNSIFYATIATIIPVLYLALAVQGPVYANLLNASLDASRRLFQGHGRLLQAIGYYIADMGLYMIAVGILFFGVFGELLTLTALYQQRAGLAPAAGLIAAQFLTVVAAIGPAVALLKYLSRWRKVFWGADTASLTCDTSDAE